MFRLTNPVSHYLPGLGWVVLILFTSVMAACAVGPNYRPPQTEMPDHWLGRPSAPSSKPSEKDLARWWDIFRDPTLTSLEEQAIRGNLDVKKAESRVRQARAARRAALSGLGPAVDAMASSQRSRSPNTVNASTTSRYQSGFDAAWELDIFGGVRRGVEAANADLQAAVEDRRDILVTLSAEVARNYVDLRTYQRRIDVARENLKAQQHSAEILRKRFQAGFISRLDVVNADAQVATTAAQIPLLETSVRQTIYSLSVLLGREPAALLDELSIVGDIPAAPPSVPVGVPSSLLRRRPDIRAAEAGIHAATARIGVATADLFPKINLTGSWGFQSMSFGSMTDWVNRFWQIGPSLDWRVFDSGHNRANIEIQKALTEQSVIAYRQTVLAALQEVENALVASTKEQDHRAALSAAVAADRKAVDLAMQLYVEGQVDFLNVIDAQRSLYASEDALAQSTGTVSTNLISLYKALGGGWQGAPDSE
jgi:multidrug efflux system outer membrane protein